jgi:hypothetical protein
MEMTMNFLMLCSVVTPLYVADCTPAPGLSTAAPGRTVTLGEVVPVAPGNSGITEAIRRYSDPQRPRDCPRYVINPDDPCY